MDALLADVHVVDAPGGDELHAAVEALKAALAAGERDDAETRRSALELCSEPYDVLAGRNLFEQAVATHDHRLLLDLLRVAQPPRCANGVALPKVIRKILELVVEARAILLLRVLFESGTVHAAALMARDRRHASDNRQSVLMWLIGLTEPAKLVACCMRHSRPFDINHHDGRGFTPLMVACSSSNPTNQEILHLLLHASRRIDVNCQSTEGAVIDCPVEERLGISPLMLAAACGDKETVEVLLSCGSRLDLTDGADNDVFWYAMQKPHLEVLHCLIKAAQRVGSYKASLRQVNNSVHVTCLLWGISVGNTNLLQSILKLPATAGADASPFRRTSSSFSSNTAIDTTDQEKMAQNGGHTRPNSGREMLNVEALANVSGPDGITPIMAAAKFNNYELCTMLLKFSDLRRQDVSGMTALLHAVASKSHKVIPHLIEHILQTPREADSASTSPAGSPTARSPRSPRHDFRIVDRDGQNVLLWAAKMDNLSMILQLLDDPRAVGSYNVNHRDRHHNFLLMYAVATYGEHPNTRLREAWLQLARRLIASPAQEINCRGPHGRTVFAEACLASHPTVRDNSLVQIPGLNANSRDKDGCTILNLVIQRGKPAVARWLLLWTKQLNLNVNLPDSKHDAPLHSCVLLAKELHEQESQQQQEVQSTIITSGGLNANYRDGELAAAVAAGRAPSRTTEQRRSSLKLLIQEFLALSHPESQQPLCDINKIDDHGRTPLVLAIVLDQEEIAELLLKTVAAWPERVDVNVKDKSGLTPLMHAIEHAMTYVSYKLLDWPSTDLGALDSQGRGILRYMMLHNRVDQARSLIRNERYTLKSATPFHWAIDNFYGEIFLALLAKPGAKRLLVQGQAVQRLLMKVAELRVFSTEKALVLDKCLVAAAKLLGGASMATILFTVLKRCIRQEIKQDDANAAAEQVFRDKLALLQGTSVSGQGFVTPRDGLIPESLIVRLLLVCIRTRILDNLPKSDCRGFLTGAFHQPSVIAHFNNSPYLANLQQLCRNNVKHIDDCLADLVVKLPDNVTRNVQRIKVKLASIQGPVRQDSLFNNEKIMPNKSGGGLHDITYIHMLCLIGAGIRDEFHRNMQTVIAQAKHSLAEKTCLTPARENSETSALPNGIEVKSLNSFLSQIQYRAAPNKSNTRMFERLEHWQTETVAAAFADTGESKRNRGMSTFRARKLKTPLSAQNVDVLRCSLTLPNHPCAKPFVELLTRLIHKRYPIIKFKNQYDGLHKRLAKPDMTTEGTWEKCMKMHFIFRSRKFSQRKKVFLPLTFAQLLENRKTQESFRSYLATLPEGGQTIANAAINFLRTLAGKHVAMIVEMQIILQPFLQLGRVLSYPYRVILEAKDSYDVMDRFKAQGKHVEELLASGKGIDGDDGEGKSLTSSPRSGHMSALSGLALMFIAKLSHKARQRHIALEKEIARQREKRRRQAIAAANIGAPSPPTGGRRLQEMPSPGITYQSAYADQGFPWRPRQTKVATPKQSPSLKPFIQVFPTSCSDLVSSTTFEASRSISMSPQRRSSASPDAFQRPTWKSLSPQRRRTIPDPARQSKPGLVTSLPETVPRSKDRRLNNNRVVKQLARAGQREGVSPTVPMCDRRMSHSPPPGTRQKTQLSRPQTAPPLTTGAEPHLQPLFGSIQANEAFQRGDWVEMHGLTRRVELNGVQGTVVDWGCDGAYHVQFYGPSRRMESSLFRPQNLVKLPGGQSLQRER